LEPITENIVKKIALRFFRHHYKYRLRYEDQPVVAKYDLEAAGGIIADGYYSFKKPDGKKFTATFEATGKNSKDETIYKPQKKILFWDGLTVASILTLFLFALNYTYHFHTLDERTILSRIGLVALSMLIGFGFFYWIARQFRRYRYIYAIEQFKKYHADEQWIALACDVFEDPNDKYFRELKNQCVYNGFGLLVVDKKLDPKILITPSRQDIFMGKRQPVEFEDKSNLPQRRQAKGLTPWWTQLGLELPKALKKDRSLLRYRRRFYHQMAITGICALLLGIVFWKEMHSAGFQTVEKSEFRNDLAKSRSNNVLEQEDYLGDSASTPVRRNANDNYWLTEKDGSAGPPPEQPLEEEARPDAPCEVLVSRGQAPVIHYPCERFLNFNGKKFVVQEGTYPNKAKAEAALIRLKSAGIEATALPLSFFSNANGYIVYTGLICNSKSEAQRDIDQLTLDDKWKNKAWTIRELSLVQK
jgi:sporulation related protein